MANLVFDFLHNYHAGERRDSDPANAYQYDEGHVMEAVVPVAVTSCEIHYWIRGMEEAEAYTPDSITQNEDNSYSITGHIPNKYFETNGELRVYIVVTDGDASITTYEGRIHVCQRSMPDDYVDDDPENEATRVLVEAKKAAAEATQAAETCVEVQESIPADYSQMSADVSQLKEDLERLGYINEVSPKWETKKRIGETGQIIGSGDAFAVSDFIQVNPNAITSVDGVHSYAPVSMPSVHLYTSEKTHVGFVYANGYTDITSDVLTNNASYIRLSQYITNDYPLESVVVYETVRGAVNELEDSINLIESSVETLSNSVSVQMSQQYLNVLTGYTASQNGKYLNDQGQLIDNPNWASLTDYVPVDAETPYGLRFAEQFTEWKNCKFCYYDASKQHLSYEMHVNNQMYTTPADCAYLRISTTNLNYDAKGHNNFNTAYLDKSTDGTTAVVVSNQNYYTNTFPRTGLVGVKWALFGDSITEHNNRSGANYDDYIRAETGVITINEGVGGSGYKNRDDNNNAFYQIALKTVTEWADADIITVAGGVNDMWGAIDTYGLGSPDDTFTAPADITGRTDNTIMACFNYMIECLIENAPNARIGVISPIPCYTTQGGTLYAEVPYNPGCNMEKFVDACKKSCALHGIPYLDLFHNSGLRPWDSNFNAKYFKTISVDSPDGLHPNELGQKWFYPMIREFLKTLK